MVGFQSLSKKITVSAAVRLMPSPPARVLRRNTNTSSLPGRQVRAGRQADRQVDRQAVHEGRGGEEFVESQRAEMRGREESMALALAETLPATYNDSFTTTEAAPVGSPTISNASDSLLLELLHHLSALHNSGRAIEAEVLVLAVVHVVLQTARVQRVAPERFAQVKTCCFVQQQRRTVVTVCMPS